MKPLSNRYYLIQIELINQLIKYILRKKSYIITVYKFQITLQKTIEMAQLDKKSIKSIDDYRHNIKLLKYHLKKQTKKNENLKYQFAKITVKGSNDQKKTQKHKMYSQEDTIKVIEGKLKRMGLVLGDLFRMADFNYEGQITKEQFNKVVLKMQCDIQQSMLNQIFYAIDTNLNGTISQDQYEEFIIAHGGGDAKNARKFQGKTLVKLGGLLKRKNLTPQAFIKKFRDPAQIEDITTQFKKLGLNNNEIMIALKVFDPSGSEEVTHEIFLKMMEKVFGIQQKQLENKEKVEDIQNLCVKLRQRKLNPIVIFQEADVDGVDGISPLELQQAFKTKFPQETNYQIKKWISLINLNNDSVITREQFMNSIRSFYTIDQLNKFTKDDTQRKKPKNPVDKNQIPVEQIMKQFSDKIQDTGMTKTELFNFLDINRNKSLDKEQIMTGLLGLKMDINFVGRVLMAMDTDESGEISLEQWLHMLGQDVQVQDVSMPSDLQMQIQPKKGKTEKQKFKQNMAKQTKQNKEKKIVKQQPKLKKQTKKQPKEQKKQQKSVQVKKPVEPIKKSKEPLKQKSVQTKKPVEPIKKSKEPVNKSSKAPIKKKSFTQDILNSNDKILQQPKTNNIKQQQGNTILKIQSEENNPEVDTTKIQQQTAIAYKKNPQTILIYFEQHDSKKLGFISQKSFKAIAKKISSKIKEEQIKSLVDSLINSDGIIYYKQWLDEIAQKYAADVKQENNVLASLTKPMKIEDTKPNIQMKQQQNEYDNDFEQQSPKKQKPNEKTSTANNILGDIIKRGDGIKGFENLLTLSTKDQTHTDKGYKLSNYINSQLDLELLNKNYLPKAENLKKTKQIFVDTNFPPNIQSLTKKPSQSTINNVTMLKWKHYKDLYKNPQLFTGGIDPNDIKQGGLGDCYFLCALCCLSEYTNMIQRLFEYYDLESGYFLVWLCIDGDWKLVQLDGMIPTTPIGQQPAFSKGQAEQLWVMLLQKAYAKVYGDYQKIVGGQAYEAIKDLSGGPGRSFSHESVKQNDLWKQLKQANQKQFLMSCGTDMKDTGKKIDGRMQSVTNQGIVLGHAYSILDVVEVNNEKILKLRNPWGTMEWKGDWSDNSSKWTPEMKKKLKYQKNENDGIFWMPFKIFFTQYNCSAINYIRPTYYYTSLAQKNIKRVLVKAKKGSFNNGFYIVTQYDHRHNGSPVNTPYFLTHLVSFLFQNDVVTKKIDERRYLYQRQGCVQFNNLKPTQEAMMLVSLQKSTNIEIGYYGDKNIEFEVDNDIMRYMQGLALLQEFEKQTQSYDKFKTWIASIGQIAFLCFKNVTDKQYTLVVELSSLSNIKIMPPQDAKKNNLKIKPNQTKTIKGIIQKLNESYSFGQFGLQFLP